MMGAPAPMGGMAGAPGQLPAARKLSGRGEGTRILLFDPQSGQVVYVKVEVKLTFDTDYATILPILPQLPSLPGVGRAPYAGAPYGSAPTAPRAPFAPQQQPVFRNVPARLLYTYTLENILEASGRLDMLLSGLAGR
jgi:hypothetical protein